MVHLRSLFGASIAPLRDTDWDRMSDYAQAFARAGLKIDPAQQYAALTRVGRMGKEFGAIMRDFDILVCPTTAIPAIEATFNHETDNLRINGCDVHPLLGWVLTVPFNMLSSAPVLSVSMVRAANSVPFGLQFVERPFDVDSVFRAALAFEDARGLWFQTPDDKPHT